MQFSKPLQGSKSAITIRPVSIEPTLQNRLSYAEFRDMKKFSSASYSLLFCLIFPFQKK